MQNMCNVGLISNPIYFELMETKDDSWKVIRTNSVGATWIKEQNQAHWRILRCGLWHRFVVHPELIVLIKLKYVLR